LYFKSRIYLRGIHEFDQQAFFEAHETLEDVWRDASGRDKAFLQGLIQTAVAFHHFTQGNVIGAASLLAKSVQTLANYPDLFGGIDVAALLQSIFQWQQALARGVAPPMFPKLQPSRMTKLTTEQP
jgi:predicted metal-dependent hydrolase